MGEKKDVKQIAAKIILIVFGCILLFSGYKIVSKLLEYNRSANEYRTLAMQYTTTDNNTPESTDQGTTAEKTDTDPNESETEAKEREERIRKENEEFPVHVNFDELCKACSDVVGWIYLPDTKLNYPITQAKDNDFYLHKLMDGTYNYGGTIFLDCACAADFSYQNSIIYGHNMNDGSMFRCITGYAEQDFYDKHPVIYLSTPDVNYYARVFSCFITPSLSEAYNIIMPDRTAYGEWQKKMAEQSMVKTNVDITPDDKILMLSTCNYSYTDARFVVMCKLEPIGGDQSYADYVLPVIY